MSRTQPYLEEPVEPDPSEIRQSIREGEYEIDVEALADRLLLHGIVVFPPGEAVRGSEPALRLVGSDEAE